MTLRGRILKVGAAKSLEIALVTVVRFVSVPLFLHAWGAELYGEWLVLYSFLVYLTLGNLGFSQAAANEMTMSVASGDRPQASITYQSTLVLTVLISVFILSASVLVTYTLPLHAWLRFSHISTATLRVVVLLFVGYVIASFMIRLILAAYRCEGVYHRGLLYVNSGLLLEFLALTVVLLAQGSVTLVATSMIIIRWLTVLGMARDTQRLFPWLRLRINDARKTEFQRLLGPSLSFAAFPAGSTLINQGAIMAIAAQLGPVAVVLFSSLRSLTNLVTRLFELVNQPLFPEASMAWAGNDLSLLRKLHRISCRASLWLGITSVLGLLTVGPWIFRIWTRGAIPLPISLLWGFVLVMLLRSLWYTSFVIPSAINKHRRLTLAYLIAAAIGLAVSAALVSMSLVGVLAGFILVELTMIAMVIPQSLRLTQDTTRAFLLYIAHPPSPLTLIRTRWR